MCTKDLKISERNVNRQKYCELNVISTVWIYHGSMLDTFSNFVHRIHVHPTIPRTTVTGPGKIRTFPADFQTFPTVILQVYQRRHEPSHELEIAIIINIIFVPLCNNLQAVEFYVKLLKK